jgi:nucleotide-binding universal stress UspA family protein
MLSMLTKELIMTDHRRNDLPTGILLATDLSSRSDRALDRAIQLAEEWSAELHVVHAVSIPSSPAPRTMWDAPWREFDDPREVAEHRLRNELGPLADRVKLRVHVEQGQAGDTILSLAERNDCGIIVTGVARNETLGRAILGDTVDYLARKATVPLLVVRNRTHGPYGQVVVATDFSPASAEALHAARTLFGRAQFYLLHGYHIPFSGILMNDTVKAEFKELGERAAGEFLRSQELPGDFPRTIEEGAPEELLANDPAFDQALIAIGSHGASAVTTIFLGSTASRILNRTSGDVLVVPFTKREGA